jgi:hypothetical protein
MLAERRQAELVRVEGVRPLDVARRELCLSLIHDRSRHHVFLLSLVCFPASSMTFCEVAAYPRNLGFLPS